MSNAPPLLYVAEPPPGYRVQPPLVVDCSVMVAAMFEEPARDQAIALMSGKLLFAPGLLVHEMVNVAARKLRAGSPPTHVRQALTDFGAQAIYSGTLADHILLTWETVSEVNNSGFNLYRNASSTAPDELLAYVPSQAPGAAQGASYRWLDGNVTPGNTYYYWLEAVSLDGGATLHLSLIHI